MNPKQVIFPKEFNSRETVKVTETTKSVADFRITNLNSCPPELVADAVCLVAGEYGLSPQKPLQFEAIKVLVINKVLNN